MENINKILQITCIQDFIYLFILSIHQLALGYISTHSHRYKDWQFRVHFILEKSGIWLLSLNSL